MALNGNFVEFSSIVEGVYRDAGYQQVNWTEAIEWIAECLRLIGAKDAFKITSTNGLTNGTVTQPDPISITDYRGDLPTGYINYIAARKIEISTDGTISDFYPMVYSTDLFSQTPIKKVLEDVPAGTYDWFEYTDEEGNILQQPVLVNGVRSISYGDYVYTYRINNSKIETSFETGYVELVYLSFVTDAHGFPMIPDNQSFIQAVKWYIIEKLDYKRWRMGEISDKVYDKSQSELSFYINRATSQADIPSIDSMESLLRTLLRTNPRIDQHNIGFKYNNIGERRRI